MDWIRLFYFDTNSRVNNNGFQCDWFPVKRDVR